MPNKQHFGRNVLFNPLLNYLNWAKNKKCGPTLIWFSATFTKQILEF